MKKQNERGRNALVQIDRMAAERMRSSHITIENARTVVVEGCRGILEYSDECVKISLGRQVLVVSGSSLSIRNMYAQLICIEGRITGIEYS